MATINKDRDMIISKNIDISNCNFEQDVVTAIDWLMKWIEGYDFQTWDTKLELHVQTNWRCYDIWLYRDWDTMHVWIDWNFVYEIFLNSLGLRSCVRQLFSNWRWVPGIYMEYKWDWCDPVLHWNTLRANYREVEDYLYEDFIDWLRDTKKYDRYKNSKKSLQDKMFNDWLFDHYYRIVEIFLQLRDLNVRKDVD